MSKKRKYRNCPSWRSVKKIYSDHITSNEIYTSSSKQFLKVTTELAKYITLPVTIDFMQCSSYGADTKSSGIVKLAKDLDEPIMGKHVILIEDIIDSGRTLSHLVKLLSQREPASLTLCTLLDKPDRRVVEVDVKYTGFEIPDEFVVGYGLDYAQKHRNLPYIGFVEFDS